MFIDKRLSVKKKKKKEEKKINKTNHAYTKNGIWTDLFLCTQGNAKKFH